MQTSSVHANTVNQNITHGKVVQEGNSVLVRIISDKGNGKYEASVAGVRLNLKSAEKLEAGSSFVGKIGFQNGQITISNTQSSVLSFVQDVKTLNFQLQGDLFGPVSSPELSALLQSMNLKPDNLSFQILLQYKQLGLKLNPKIMQKIRRLAEKSPDPKKTSQKLVELAQKGIEINGDINLENLFFDSNAEQKQKEKESPSSQLSENFMLNEIKSFISSILNGSLENTPGPLTVLNHRGFKKTASPESTWITIPLEIRNLEKDIPTGNGFFRILLGSSDRKMQKMSLELNYLQDSFRFLINRNPSQGLKYAVSPSSNINTEKLEKGLAKYRPEQVLWETLEDNNLNLEDFSLAGGFA